MVGRVKKIFQQKAKRAPFDYEIPLIGFTAALGAGLGMKKNENKGARSVTTEDNMKTGAEDLLGYWLEKEASKAGGFSIPNFAKIKRKGFLEALKEDLIPFYARDKKYDRQMKDLDYRAAFLEDQARDARAKGRRDIAKTVGGISLLGGGAAMANTPNKLKKRENEKQASQFNRKGFFNFLFENKEMAKKLRQREINNMARRIKKEEEGYKKLKDNVLGAAGLAGTGYVGQKLLSPRPISVNISREEE